MTKPRKIIIFDTTLRDGEQSPGASLNNREKLQIAKQLDRLRVDIIEAGFPIASVGDFEAVKEIASEVKRPIIAGLARCSKKDIDRAAEALEPAGKPRIHVFLATSKIHRDYKLRMTPDEVGRVCRELLERCAPGGRYVFLQHVAAPAGTADRTARRRLHTASLRWILHPKAHGLVSWRLSGQPLPGAHHQMRRRDHRIPA